MWTTITLFVILIFSDGIFGINRNARTTQGDSTGHLTTDRNAIAEYISQKIRGIEQATELSGNPNFSPGSAPNLGPGIAFGAPPRRKQQKESGNMTPGQYVSDGSSQAIPGTNPLIPAPIQKNLKDDSMTKRIYHNLKPSGDDNGRIYDSSSKKPDGYAMRISAESFEIDATIDASNGTGSLTRGNWSNLAEGESENGYSDLTEGSDDEKSKQTTEGPGMEDENMPGERMTTMDPVDEEIKHVLDALPKLPDLTFTNDNNTHFVFHKDPEEAALDDRITQVARQLAETSLRRQYEEQKLGHYIPIRLRHFDDEYPPNAFTPMRKLGTDKAYNALDILHRIQQPEVRFRALSIPQHIYNGPLYRSTDEPLQPQTKLELSDSPGPVYVTETDGNTQMAMAPLFNPNGFGAIVQLSPRYGLPIPKVSLDQNRIPFFFGLSQPKPIQPFHNHNDLNTYSYREIA